MANLQALGPKPAPRFLNWPSIVEALRDLMQARGASRVYLVGGAVRDAFMNRTIHDVDFATADDGRKLAKIIADKLHGAYYPLDADRGVGRAIVMYNSQQFVVDVARF